MPLDPDTWAAYRATDYVALLSPPIILRVDEQCPKLDSLLVQKGVRGAAFVTAWNPHGVLRSRAENDLSHEELLSVLAEYGCMLIEGEGRGRIGNWPPEKSVLAIGIEDSVAEGIGCRFQQNAIVFHELGCPTRLVALVDIEGRADPLGLEGP